MRPGEHAAAMVARLCGRLGPDEGTNGTGRAWESPRSRSPWARRFAEFEEVWGRFGTARAGVRAEDVRAPKKHGWTAAARRQGRVVHGPELRPADLVDAHALLLRPLLDPAIADPERQMPVANPVGKQPEEAQLLDVHRRPGRMTVDGLT